MKRVFLEKYKDYCMHCNRKDEVFKMVQREDEILENIVEMFAQNIQRAKRHNLDEVTLKNVLLKTIRDEWIDLLNFMGKGYVSQFPFEEICEFCKNIVRGKAKYGKNLRDPVMSRVRKFASRMLSREELGNFLDNLKIDILGNLSEKLVTIWECCIIYFFS